MSDNPSSEPKEELHEQLEKHSKSVWHLSKIVACSLIVLALAASIFIGASKNKGLETITVTAISADKEPKDHNIPLFKRKEALPDYEVHVVYKNERTETLGARPNMSAANGITWTCSEPIAIYEIASIRLSDKDQMSSDVLQEVSIGKGEVTSGNYVFKFETASSASIGLWSFFKTPLGLAILGVVAIAVLLMLIPIISAAF